MTNTLIFDGVTPLQMYWEEWPSEAYSDRNHLDAEGGGFLQASDAGY